MKRFSLFIFVFAIAISSAFAYKFKTSDFAFDAKMGLCDMDVLGNKITVLCYGESEGKYNAMSVFVRDNNEWTRLPATCLVNNVEENLLSEFGHIAFDKQGNIWMTGKYLYKYSNGAWKAYFIDDEHKNIRKYLGLAVDANGYVWASTRHYVDPDNYGSSLLRLKDDKLDVILKTNDFFPIGQCGNSSGANAIVSFPDGSVGVQMPLEWGATEGGNKQDFYRLYPDGRVEKSVIDQIYYSIDKAIKCLYAESNDKLWIGEAKSSYSAGEDPYHQIEVYQTSGLAYFDGSKWSRFGPENNLQQLDWGENMKMPVNWIEKARNGKYFVLTARYLNTMDDSHILKRISWDTVFAKITLIKSNSVVKDTFYDWKSDAYLTSDTCDEGNFLGFKKILLTDNNELVILGSQGIYIMDANSYAAVENEAQVKIAVSPNPAYDYITIQNAEGIKHIEIYDVLGRKVWSAKNPPATIDVSQLTAGTYFVKFIGSSNILSYVKFVKKEK